MSCSFRGWDDQARDIRDFNKKTFGAASVPKGFRNQKIVYPSWALIWR
jgi:hypothetical protein